jgi:hypothetical protein
MAGGAGTLIRMTNLVQVDLRSDNRLLTCWVEPRVKPGDRITLKNSEEPQRLGRCTRRRRPPGRGHQARLEQQRLAPYCAHTEPHRHRDNRAGVDT